MDNGRVEQVDRNAAVRLLESGGQDWQAKEVRLGQADHWPLVQAFARHRLAALASVAQPGVAEARTIVTDLVRLADMGLEESLREPEENGNYAAYERAKRWLAAHPSPVQGAAEASAVEAMREVLIRIARMIPGVICADGVSDAFLAGIPDELAHYRIERPTAEGAQTQDSDIGKLIAGIPEPVFWQLGHDGDGPDPSLFKARLFDPDEMVRPCEGWGVTPADALQEALAKFAPAALSASDGKEGVS